MSNRKPYNDRSGYIASLRSGAARGWIVIYDAKEQGIDVDGCYAVVCEAHGQIVGDTSLRKARASMKAPDQFCFDCAAVVRNRGCS